VKINPTRYATRDRRRCVGACLLPETAAPEYLKAWWNVTGTRRSPTLKAPWLEVVRERRPSIPTHDDSSQMTPLAVIDAKPAHPRQFRQSQFPTRSDNGLVHFQQEVSWLGELMAELLGFPREPASRGPGSRRWNRSRRGSFGDSPRSRSRGRWPTWTWEMSPYSPN
jgi:hypothetical protein